MHKIKERNCRTYGSTIKVSRINSFGFRETSCIDYVDVPNSLVKQGYKQIK